MRLTDIKKLKVVELRSRLKDLGLDSRGLKAELVDRLWSRAEEDGNNRQDEDQQTLPTGTTDSLPPHTARSRELTNAATQTDPDPGPPPVPQPPCVTLSAGEEDGQPGKLLEPPEVRGRSFYEFKEEIKYKRAKSPVSVKTLESSEQDEDKVRFDTRGGHLHFEASADGAGGQPRFWEGFPLLWSGCRLTHGVQQGQVGFEMRIERRMLRMKKKEEEEEEELWGVRVGWSTADASLLLGDDERSFCFDGRGIKVSAGVKEEFGERVSEGDIITSYASFSRDGAVELSFHKNGVDMGVGFSLEPSVLQGRLIFPHVLCKSCSVRLLLDPTAPPWYPGPPGFTALSALPPEQRVHVTGAAASRGESEVILMVGLPGSGKTSWAKTYMKQNPEKGFRLLGTEELLTCMMSFSRDGAVELSFHKNGVDMGVGFSLEPSVLQGRLIFPHVLCKSCSVRLLLDPTAPPWYPGPPGFTALSALPPEQRVHVTGAAASRGESEVILMVGLPGSGKTSWAKTYMKQNPEKGFRLLGTEELLTCMMSGDYRLQQASQCLTELIKVAAETPGNVIIDQCNVLFSARRHKLQLFSGFRRRMVVVFPTLQEWKRRLDQKTEGEKIPHTSLLKTQVSCSLPELQPELLEELMYVELQQEEAKALLEELRENARRLLPPVVKPEKKPRVYGNKRLYHSGPQWSRCKNQRMKTECWRLQPSLQYYSPFF